MFATFVVMQMINNYIQTLFEIILSYIEIIRHTKKIIIIDDCQYDQGKISDYICDVYSNMAVLAGLWKK